MRTERGIIAITTWIALGMVAVIALEGGAVWIQSKRLATSKAETVATKAAFDLFKESVRQLGEQQAEKAKAEDVINAQRKAQTDEENKRIHASDAAVIASLRAKSANPSERPLPSPSPTSRRPDLICLDRESYKRENGIALERLFAGARSLADEGAAATVDLNSAKSWAQKLKIASFEEFGVK